MKAFVLIISILLLYGCGDDPRIGEKDHAKYSTKPEINNNKSGIGMKFNGKLGIELAPGVVMGFDGKVGPGIGF